MAGNLVHLVICGVDEAGRGPVMGPMVVAAVMVENDRELRRFKVKDSKLLTRQKREELEPRIREVATVEVEVISAAEIDSFMRSSTLNVLEVERFASLIDRLRPDRAFVDAADVVEERFGNNIMERLICRPEMVCQHRADIKYPVVSAASIVAKVVRDRAMDDIEVDIGCPIGSGYAHDHVTIEFIASWTREKGTLPPHVRRSWKTAKDLYALSRVTKLTRWMEQG
jgi:ribonuclease HII